MPRGGQAAPGARWRRLAAGGRVPHQAERARGRRGCPRRTGSRAPPQARRSRRADLRRGSRGQHARAGADQPRMVPVLRLRADGSARAQHRRRDPVLDRLPAAHARHCHLRRGARYAAHTAGTARRVRGAGSGGLRGAGADRRQRQRHAARLPGGGVAGRAGDDARLEASRRTGRPGEAQDADTRRGQARRWAAAAAAGLVIAQLAC